MSGADDKSEEPGWLRCSSYAPPPPPDLPPERPPTPPERPPSPPRAPPDVEKPHKRKRQKEKHRSASGGGGAGHVAMSDAEKMAARDRAVLVEDPRAKLPASAPTAPSGFSFDSRADRDNVAFGCVYAGHLPRYKLLGATREESAPRYFKPQSLAADADRPTALLTAAMLRAGGAGSAGGGEGGGGAGGESCGAFMAIDAADARADAPPPDGGGPEGAMLERQARSALAVETHPREPSHPHTRSPPFGSASSTRACAPLRATRARGSLSRPSKTTWRAARGARAGGGSAR